MFWGSKVSENRARGAAAGKIVEMGEQPDLVFCPRCKSDRVYRLERMGLLRREVYPIFGYYPWQCKACGHEMMLRKRNRRKTKHRHA